MPLLFKSGIARKLATWKWSALWLAAISQGAAVTLWMMLVIVLLLGAYRHLPLLLSLCLLLSQTLGMTPAAGSFYLCMVIAGNHYR